MQQYKTVALHLVKSSKSAVMKVSSFYGAGRSRPRIRFLASAKDIVESQESDDLEIVLLSPKLANQGIESDEEGSDNILNEECLPDEVSGEVEIHGEAFEDKITEKESRHSVWRKSDEISLRDAKKLQKSDEVMKHGGESMYQTFSLFFSDSMISLLIEQTNLYATKDKNMQTFKTNDTEMRKFLGLLLISGYHDLPSEADYWSTSEDLEAPIFSNIMKRDRFRVIKSCLHIADNDNLAQSKVAKVLPLLELLRTNCQQFGVFHKNLSIDESMVPYRGLHSAKQYIKGKPVKFGYKLSMLCSSDGYPFNFEIYRGKDESRTNLLGTRVVEKMLSPVTNPSQHVVFFDNFFTSHTLLTNLAGENVRACGTIKDNRTNHCRLISKKDFKKQPRGIFDFRSDGSVVRVKWNDNYQVTVASNYYGVYPIQKVERRVKNEQKKTVDQPFLIKMYNKGMGGVDVCNRLLSSYSLRLRSRKWLWNLFSHMLNLSVVAANNLYNHVNSNGVSYIQISKRNSKSPGKSGLFQKASQRTNSSAKQSSKVRRKQLQPRIRYPRKMCALCQKNTRLCCAKCGKRLHKLCSDQYHRN